MTDQGHDPLRRRMIEDMTIRKFASKDPNMTTCRGSSTSLLSSAACPHTASFEDVRRYQLHLAESGAGVSDP